MAMRFHEQHLPFLPQTGRFWWFFRLLQSLVGCRKAIWLLQKLQQMWNESLNDLKSHMNAVAMRFISCICHFCLKMADFSDFWGCCKLWQVAAKPSKCSESFQMDQLMYKHHANASRKNGIDSSLHLSVKAICSNFKRFFAANAACGLRSAHFLVFLTSESWLGGQKTSI